MKHRNGTAWVARIFLLGAMVSPMGCSSRTPSGQAPAKDKDDPALAAPSKDPLTIINAGDDPIRAIALSRDGKQLLIASTFGAGLWDTGTGKSLRLLESPAPFINSVAISPDGTLLVTGGGGLLGGGPGMVHVNEAASGRWLHTPGLNAHSMAVNTVAIAPDGEWLLTAADDETVRISQTDNRREWALIRVKNSAAAIAPDGTWFLVANGDSAIVYNPGGTELRRVKVACQGPIAISPDGKWVLSADAKLNAHVWNAVTGQIRHQFKGVPAAFGPDWIVTTTGLDKTAHVWDAATGKELFRLHHLDRVDAVAISSDGKKLFTASQGFVFIWDANWKKVADRPETSIGVGRVKIHRKSLDDRK